MIEYNIPYEFCTYLQKLQYEVEAYKDMLSFMIEKKMEKDLFDNYHKEYLGVYLEYSLAKKELEEQIKENYPGIENFNWAVDFTKHICEIEVIEIED